MDMDTLGSLIQTLIQQNMMLNHKVDTLTQEVGNLKSVVNGGALSPLSSPTPEHRPLTGSPSTPSFVGNHGNPLANSSSNNPLTSSNSNPLSHSNTNNVILTTGSLSSSTPNVFLPSTMRPNPLATSPTQFSPPYGASASPAMAYSPFSAHPLELRGNPSPSGHSNPFMTSSNQPLSLSSFPH